MRLHVLNELFYGAISVSGYIVSKSGTFGERWIERDLEGSGYGVIGDARGGTGKTDTMTLSLHSLVVFLFASSLDEGKGD